MSDIWAFLLQTLTASGAAALLLIVKAMFRDKLSPRWQFSIWGILGLILLRPAGSFGRYTLFNWPFFVETAKTLLTETYTLTLVTFPFPLLPSTSPNTVWDWLFLLYLFGVFTMLLRYLIGYVRLRSILRYGQPVNESVIQQLHNLSHQYQLPLCPAVEISGLSSAFICGLFSPLLVLPAEIATDEKVLLHELMHLKHRDILWGVLICLFRCIHWCNPLLWYCADQAGNDLESLCDQRVLECLEGEERREYGRILLSMASETYARVPGTSSMANGGKNIRRRIEAIVRFKKYPAGMALVSVCVALVLITPLILGTQSVDVYDEKGYFSRRRTDAAISLSSARTVWCTTPAGALDAYGKALLTHSGAYRTMCAPLDSMDEIADVMYQRISEHIWPSWNIGIASWADISNGYYIYNLEPIEPNIYRALVVLPLNYHPDDLVLEDDETCLATQYVRVEQEGKRWVVTPLEDFNILITDSDSMYWGSRQLPHYTYSNSSTDTAVDFRVEVHHQKVFVADNAPIYSKFWSPSDFHTPPNPNAEFNTVYWNHWTTCTYTGPEEEKAGIKQIGTSIMPMENPEERPFLRSAHGSYASGSSNSGENWCTKPLDSDWDSVIWMGGGGSTYSSKEDYLSLPCGYAADLYLNGEKAAELTLFLQEGDPL